ncbi:MAG: hypothetical protein KGO51_17170, partial [Alphaproteobacteria bacterium]|nr:hypothetical protein [Alphaproteobacteria bacterium]
PARVAGFAGDYILDTGQARTVLALTQAQEAGFGDPELNGAVEMAGLVLPAQPVTVAKIDVRTGLFPTPISGIIGADALRGHVLDIRFDPCRVRFYPAGRAPPFRRAMSLPLTFLTGAPAVRAAVTDGARAEAGLFVLSTGSDTAVRISDAAAAAPGAPKPREVYPYGVARPTLRALSFASGLYQDLGAGLITPRDPQELGEIGAPVLSHYRVRFDFPAARLLLSPQTERAPATPRP